MNNKEAIMTIRTARAVHIFALSALIILMSTVSYAQQTAERIMAVVNDDIITTSEFSERVHMVMETSNLPKNPEVARQIGPQILDAMVDEKLQLQEKTKPQTIITTTDILEVQKEGFFSNYSKIKKHKIQVSEAT